MKLNIAYPATGSQKVIEIEDEHKLRAIYDQRMSHEIDGGLLGDQFKGYIFKISGGNDKQGFPMKQGVLVNHRVRLLLADGHSCYRIRRDGERKRKSVRGCIVGPDIAVCNLVVIKKGDAEIPGVTDTTKPRRLGPKRANRIRKLFNLAKEDDVRKYAIRREIAKAGKKAYTKAPKIQRLVTPARLQRKRSERAERRERIERSTSLAKEYQAKVHTLIKEKADAKHAKHAKKRSVSQRKESTTATKTPAAAPKAAAAATKAPAATATKAPAAKAAAAAPKAAAKPAAAKKA